MKKGLNYMIFHFIEFQRKVGNGDVYIFRTLLVLFISCLGTSLYSQPIDYRGSWEFKVKEGCRAIKFNVNNNDTIFTDTKNQYQLKVKQCGTQCFLVSGEKLRLENEMIIELSGVRQIPIIIFEVTRIRDDEKMIVEFFNNKGSSFSTEFKFKKGKFKIDVNRLLTQGKASRKKGFKYYFIRQKYFEKKSD